MAALVNWATDGADWPNRAASCFVEAAGLRWHVQVMGEGPVVLLLHGTGASTHSWRDVMPKLAGTFTVVAPDLPGHGFTSRPTKASLSLPGMAAAIAGLLRELKLAPERAAGHSAGAAVLVRMAVERFIAPDFIVSFNGAFFPVSGVAGQFFSPIAKVVAGATVMQKLFARQRRTRRETGTACHDHRYAGPGPPRARGRPGDRRRHHRRPSILHARLRQIAPCDNPPDGF